MTDEEKEDPAPPREPQPMEDFAPAFEVTKIEFELFRIHQHQLSRLGDQWAARFDPTRRKGHVPFSKGIVNEFAAMIGRMLGRVLFVLLLFVMVYSLGFVR